MPNGRYLQLSGATSSVSTRVDPPPPLATQSRSKRRSSRECSRELSVTSPLAAPAGGGDVAPATEEVPVPNGRYLQLSGATSSVSTRVDPPPPLATRSRSKRRSFEGNE